MEATGLAAIDVMTAEVERLAAQLPDETGFIAGALETVKQQLTDLQGRIDSYVADAEKYAEAQASDPAVQAARDRADIRESAIREGTATAEDFDAAAILGHDELDRLHEEDLLGSVAPHLDEAAEAQIEVASTMGREYAWNPIGLGVQQRTERFRSLFESLEANDEIRVSPGLRIKAGEDLSAERLAELANTVRW